MVEPVCAVVAGVAGMKNTRDGGCRCLRAFFFNQGRAWGDYGKAGRFGRVFLRFVTDDTFDTFFGRCQAGRIGRWGERVAGAVRAPDRSVLRGMEGENGRGTCKPAASRVPVGCCRMDVRMVQVVRMMGGFAGGDVAGVYGYADVWGAGTVWRPVAVVAVPTGWHLSGT